MGRNEIIREEAEQWRRHGQIDQRFHDWLKHEYPVGRDQGTERRLQQILLAFAGLLAIIGIFTLVAEFWQDFSDPQKLWILRLFAVAAIALGTGLYFMPKTRVLTHVFLPLAIPLYIFSMAYADPTLGDPPDQRGTLDAQELSSVLVGVLAMLGSLLVGLQRFPSLAMGSTPGLIGVLFFLDGYLNLDQAGEQALQWSCLAIVLVLHAVLLLVWLARIPMPYAWDPLALRLAVFANVPMGFVLIMELIDSYAYEPYNMTTGTGGGERFDGTLVGVILTALYVGALLGVGLRLGLPELVGISGVFLVVDAFILGSDKGGIIGAVLAILATAVLLGVLAQRGLLRRIFKPRRPPTTRA